MFYDVSGSSPRSPVHAHGVKWVVFRPSSLGSGHAVTRCACMIHPWVSKRSFGKLRELSSGVRRKVSPSLKPALACPVSKRCTYGYENYKTRAAVVASHLYVERPESKKTGDHRIQ